ncbi:glycosyl hydrolase family 61-domain-containing protein [Fomes fomentarius]|nr:glycosyl hydrolase family 61-domain-containing protein [Fomes fomentarius]
MSRLTLLLFSIAYVVPHVTAHGFVSKVVIDGKEYKGNQPSGNNAALIDSPIRQISSFDPIYGADSRDLNCGRNAKKAALVVNADPGSQVSFFWVASWPHNTGPVITYMTPCGKTSCKDFDPSGAEWFKIDEAGKRNKDSAQWVQQDLFDGKPYTLTLPKNIAPGEYLIRHEVIGLHIANDFRKAEFYPSCVQARITGNGNGAPLPNESVTFPGTGYQDNDPGLFGNNFFTPDSQLQQPYEFPGPNVAQFVNNKADLKANAVEDPVKASSATSAPSATPDGAGCHGHGKKMKRSFHKSH